MPEDFLIYIQTFIMVLMAPWAGVMMSKVSSLTVKVAELAAQFKIILPLLQSEDRGLQKQIEKLDSRLQNVEKMCHDRKN